jgi:hypothetical protein
MDNFKVPFCLRGGRKFQPKIVWTNTICSIAQWKFVSGFFNPTPDASDSKYALARVSQLPSRYWASPQIKRLALLCLALLIPVYLVGCGSGSSIGTKVTPPSSTSSGSGTTGSGDSGGTGTGTGTTGTGTTGTGDTGGTGTTGTTGTGDTGGTTGTGGTGDTGGTTGTGGTGGTGTTGTGGTGTTGSGDFKAIVSSTDVNTRLNYGSAVGDWKVVCVEPNCAPGGSGIPTATSQTINHSAPSKDGKSMHFSVSANSTSAYTNALWVNVSGNCDNCTRINTDFWVYITSTANYVNAWEFDSFIFDKMNGYKNMWGMQCVNGSNWEIDSDFGWKSVGIACNLTVGWHHIQVFNHRIINEVGGPKGYGYNYYDSLIVDGVKNDLTGKTTPAEPYPKSYTQSTSGFQFQLDANKNSTAVTVDEYLDMANFYGGN